MTTTINKDQTDDETKQQLYLKHLVQTTKPIEYHMCSFRTPIFLYGYYTKSRRDVSQTPFVVMKDVNETDNGDTSNTNDQDAQQKDYQKSDDPAAPPPQKKPKKEKQTLGVTSVEEQICGPIEDLLKISMANNPPPRPINNNRRQQQQQEQSGNDNSNNSDQGTSAASSSVKYGMIKFHASGREDMDVRMLVRTDSETCHGRPFCVQIIDSCKCITSLAHLLRLANRINHTNMNDDSNPHEIAAIKNDNVGGAKNDKENNTFYGGDNNNNNNNSNVMSYGKNPLGVGIDRWNFKVVSSKVFSGLQQDTESKVKHYGCYCWSQKELPEVGDDLTAYVFGKTAEFPLQIQQKTPIRVLHRRANMKRERQIVKACAKRIDAHHFRLELSTSAGTYVKEFVSGDLGRSKPSISSLLGCKTNLLQLDCEGIEIPISDGNGDGM
jgi:tRNA U54 and U55 pseudouridine synthase Pus10